MCIVCNVWLKIANYILRRSNVKNPTFDQTRFGCWIFDIRLMVDRISNSRHSIEYASVVEYSTVDCAADRIEKIRSNNEANRIEFAKVDPTECTCLDYMSFLHSLNGHRRLRLTEWGKVRNVCIVIVHNFHFNFAN